MRNKNVHHTLWTRADYKRATMPHLLREHPFMKHEMWIPDHNELHANIDPLPRMSVDLARMSLQFFVDWGLRPTYEASKRLLGFDAITEYYHELNRFAGRLAVEAGQFGEHFTEQRGYIERH